MGSQKLDSKKLGFYKKLLLNLKEDLTTDIKTMSKNPRTEDNESRDVSGHVLHMADVATDMYDREFNLGLASTEREVLFKIDSALKRITDKNFGVCTECKKSIPLTRLKALPYTATCLRCQEKLEAQR